MTEQQKQLLREMTVEQLLSLLPSTIGDARLVIVKDDLPIEEDRGGFTVGYGRRSDKSFGFDWACGYGDESLRDAIIGLMDIIIGKFSIQITIKTEHVQTYN